MFWLVLAFVLLEVFTLFEVEVFVFRFVLFDTLVVLVVLRLVFVVVVVLINIQAAIIVSVYVI